MLRVHKKSFEKSAFNVSEGLVCTDTQDRLLMVMPPSAARRSGLIRRLVAVVLTDTQHRLWLTRHVLPHELFPSLWDVTGASAVLGLESRQDAARRSVFARCGVEVDSFKLWRSSTQVFGCEGFNVSLYRAVVATGSHTLAQQNAFGKVDSLFASKAEVQGLVAQSPELFSPLLQWAVTGVQKAATPALD